MNKMIVVFLLLIAGTLYASEIVIQPGQSIVVSGNEVSCDGPASEFVLLKCDCKYAWVEDSDGLVGSPYSTKSITGNTYQELKRECRHSSVTGYYQLTNCKKIIIN